MNDWEKLVAGFKVLSTVQGHLRWRRRGQRSSKRHKQTDEQERERERADRWEFSGGLRSCIIDAWRCPVFTLPEYFLKPFVWHQDVPVLSAQLCFPRRAASPPIAWRAHRQQADFWRRGWTTWPGQVKSGMPGMFLTAEEIKGHRSYNNWVRIVGPESNCVCLFFSFFLQVLTISDSLYTVGLIESR